jgi:hypothetical protein
MKYIESFRLFESKDIDVVSIEQDARNNLAYLLDGGEFKLEVFNNTIGLYYDGWATEVLVFISLIQMWDDSNGRKTNRVSWQSIKDEVMPYLELVSSKYDIDNIRLDRHRLYSVSELSKLEDLEDMIYSVSFVIKK